MKGISRWASRHRSLAVVLILLGELINLGNGLLLGINGFGSMPAGGLTLLLLCLLGGVCWLRTQWVNGQSFGRGRGLLAGAFLGNFLLAIVAGGLGAARVDTPTTNGAAWGSRRVVMRADTVINPGEAAVSPLDQSAARTDPSAKEQQQKRIKFILLFALGLGLAVFLAFLGCALLCSEVGLLVVLGVLSLVASYASMLGAYFFLSRALTRTIRPWREMARSERRRTIFRAIFLFISINLFLALILG